MPKSVYFDSNLFFEIFEERDPTLFPKLQSLVSSGRVQVVASELNLVEILAGNHLNTFASGINRLFSLSPLWLFMSGLTIREVATEYSQHERLTVKGPVGTFMTWSELLPWIITDDALTAIPDLFIPTADALLQAYPVGSIGDRKKYWKAELKLMGAEFGDMMQYVGTAQNLFRKLVGWTLKRTLGRTRSFADELYTNPDRAPAFRLDAELNYRVLNVTDPRWTTNDFVDHLHAGAIPYVDLFVTRDGTGKTPGLIQKIEWYDAAIRRPAGSIPYSRKLCRTWDQLEAMC